jgi:acetate CoA/acetoacetate CoA-transferase alpha subunit
VLEKPILTPQEAAAKVQEGDVLMSGGFMGCGAAHTLIQALKARGMKGLTLISTDTAMHDFKTGNVTGIGHLVQDGAFSKIIASHIGLNQETQRQMNAGETEVELVPQGTLAERIRAGGAGLGGFLTPTGLGTEVEEGKQVITIADRPYLLELPLKANIAFIKAKLADKAGNLVYAGTARNFNPMMATAADLVIAEAEEIVEVGALDPNHVHTPSIFVDFLVRAERLEM